MRYFPKTIKFLENLKNYKNKNNKYDFFQMLKYHSLQPFTVGTFTRAFYGKDFTESYKGISIFKFYKENGFIIGNTQDFCSADMFYDIRETNYEWEYFDHNMNLACDPNLYNIEEGIAFFRGAYSVIRRFLYEKKL